MLLFKMIENHLSIGSSVVAESNFYTEFNIPRFNRRLQERWNMKTVGFIARRRESCYTGDWSDVTSPVSVMRATRRLS